MRTTPLPDLKLKSGTAEFFLLFTAAGVENVRFVSGDEPLKAAAAMLRTAHYNLPFPDAGPENTGFGSAGAGTATAKARASVTAAKAALLA